MWCCIELISNVTNEIMLVGAIYKNPDLLVEYSQYIKSKYDFYDEGTKFFYDQAETLYATRTQEFTKTSVLTYMAEDDSRMRLYKEFKGWNTIDGYMKLANPDDAKGYFEVLKKFSLLREYQRNGFNIEGICKHPKFEKLKAQDIYKLIRGKADKINTVILTNDEAEILNTGLDATINERLKAPDMGISIPFKTMNELFRGFKLGTMMCSGMLSNAGKTRFMMSMVAHIALVEKQKTLVLLNEMDLEAVRYCLITTVINNPEFQELHGVKLHKNEREITLGLYRDANGEFIMRKTDDKGNFTETYNEYIARVAENSEEYRNVIAICNWIDEASQGLIFAKDISTDYTDKSLEFEIRKAVLTKGVKYVFYDTLKNETSSVGEWSSFKITTTKLSEIAKQLRIFLYGSIQLTDSANDYESDMLNSNNIAEAKSIKHVLDTLVLYKEIPNASLGKYYYLSRNDDWGEFVPTDLRKDRRYYIGNVDKNRFGSKKKLLFEVNLDRNTWCELGEVLRK